MKRSKGVTLTELIIVLALMSLIAGMSMPFFSRFTSSSRLKNVSREISSIFRQARQMSITDRSVYSVCIDTESSPQALWIEDKDGRRVNKIYKIVSGVVINNPDDPFDSCTFENDKLTFKPVGSVDGKSGYLWLSQKDGKATRITVLKMSGRVQLESQPIE